MAQPCTICIHPRREEIDKLLVDPTVGNRTIAHLFAVSRYALMRHKANHLPKALAAEQAGRELLSREKLVEELREAVCYVQRLLRACDEWLRDPTDPGRYCLDPRAEDLHVVYYAEVGGKPIRRKAPLAELLEATGRDVESWETKHADPRELLLKSSRGLLLLNETFLKMMGELKELEVNIVTSPDWERFRTRLLEALAPFPEARRRIVEVFSRVA